MAGYCDTILVTLHEDGSVSVVDNGRGIPVDMHPTEKKVGLEMVLTELHAGGKFGGGGYKIAGGLHGVGRLGGQRSERAAGRRGPQGRQAVSPELPAGLPRGSDGDGRAHLHAWHHDPLVARPQGLPRPDPRLGDGGRPAAGARLPDQGGQPHPPRRDPRLSLHLLLRGRHPGLRELSQREPQRRQRTADVRGARDRRQHGGDRRPVPEHRLYRARAGLRQQHQHRGGWRAPDRLPFGADHHPQQVRAQGRDPEGERPQPQRRRRPGRSHRGDQRQAPGTAVRGSDQDQARQQRGHRPGVHGAERRPDAVPGREPHRGQADRRAVAHRGPSAPGRRPGPRAGPAQVAARVRRPCRASSRTAASATPSTASSSSSRATAPAAPPNRAGNGATRPSCRCGARSSTSRRRAPTRSSPTRRSRT